MKKLCCCLSISFFSFLAARTQSLNSSDGPYIQYRQNEVIVRSLTHDSLVTKDSFDFGEKKKHFISVHFSNHAGWDFSLPFKKEIANEKTEWNAPDKIFALSDIEGEFENTRNLLIKAGVMDSLYRWTFGKGHVVICGDLFDRGNDVVAELWLLYKLEDEARSKGGYLHTLLGNHDIMNMSGDLRYVQPKYFAHARAMGLDYMQLYSDSTELGRWLRSKNTIEKIGDNLYLHGGISPAVFTRQMDLETINRKCRPYYDQGRRMENIGDTTLRVFFGRDALFWYRGYFLDPRASQSFVDSTLRFYNVKKIVVGHTIALSNIASYYEGKIIGVDVNEHEGHSEAIFIQGGQVEVMDSEGKTKAIGAGPEKPEVE